jgi:hypothetical protein
MSKYQFYSPLDPLSSYKQEKSNYYGNCDFYENFENNAVTTLRSGFIEDSPVLERITTDGHISIEGVSREPSYIIAKNVLFTLERSKSIQIIISDASFLVSTISIDGKNMHDIHTSHGSIALYDRILNYLYNGVNTIVSIESIRFRNQELIDYYTDSMHQTLDLKTGRTKIKSR